MNRARIDSTYAWLLPTLEVYHAGSEVVLRDTECEATYTQRTTELLSALELIDGSRSLTELLQRGPIMASLISQLQANGWLVQLSRPLAAVTGDDDVRSRQLSYFAHLQRSLPDLAFDEVAPKRVLIVGTGGIGCHLAMNLAGSGVKKFYLNDMDTVSSSNLNRQVYFTRHDVGTYKVTALARAMSERFGDLDIQTCTQNHDHSSQAALPECDAIVVCGERETIWTRPELVQGTPMLMAGYLGSTSVVGPCVLPGVGPSWSELMRDRARTLGTRIPQHKITRPRAWNSSGAAINCTTGGLLVEATLRMLAPSLGGPILVNERLELDMRTLTSTRISFSRPQASTSPATPPSVAAE
ncbi:MAG: hypothetical protein RL685_871 [Pseudomonadota bacterium]|jgi:hypothetical protein